MNKPESKIPEELLSAYLDGEVTAEEEQRVVEALQQSEVLRNLLAELKQVRSEIQSLPRYQLPEGFSSRMVQACQNQHEAVLLRPAVRQTKTWKWAAGFCAAAATLLIAILSFGPNLSQPTVRTANLDGSTAADDVANDLGVVEATDSNVETERLESIEPLSERESLDLGVGNQPPAFDMASASDRPKVWRKSQSAAEQQFDAVVTVSRNQFAGRKVWEWIDDPELGRPDAWQATERLERGLNRSQRDSSDGDPVRLEIEGTREEIEQALAAWNVRWTNLSLMNLDRQATELPRRADRARQSQLIRSDTSVERADNEAREEQSLNDVRRSKTTEDTAPKPEALSMAADQHDSPTAAASTRASSRDESAALKGNTNTKTSQPERRYRILLIARPN